MRCPRPLRSPPLACLLALAAGLGLAACGRAARPNLVLISLDTVRADHLGCYGYGPPTTPNLDRLAEGGVLFERVLANSPWTLPSHGSLLTGLTPRSHGLKGLRLGLHPQVATLAGELQRGGWHTLGIVGSVYLGPRHGLDRDFDRFELFPEQPEGPARRATPAQVELALEWIDERGEAPFFLFFHSYDAHSDYDPSPGFRDRFRRDPEVEALAATSQLLEVRRGERSLDAASLAEVVARYDAGLAELDHDLGVLLDGLSERGLDGQTLVIVTSDHGEEFLEHGGVLHGRTLFEESLRVPLLMRGPGLDEGRRIGGVAQLHDVMPTLLGLLGLPVPEPIEGIDLHDSIQAGTVPPERVALAGADHRNVVPDRKRAVARGSLKLVVDRLDKGGVLYDLSTDPEERRDVAAAHREELLELADELRRYNARQPSAVSIAPLASEERQQLRALGYLDDVPEPAAAPGPAARIPPGGSPGGP